MKNSIFIWGSKSYARIVNDFIKNYKKELNLDYFTTSKKNRLKIKYFFDPYSKKIDFSHNAIFSNNFSQLAENIKNCKFFATNVIEKKIDFKTFRFKLKYKCNYYRQC